MGNTLTIRLPEELQRRLREKARRIGLPVGRVVREFVERGLSQDEPADGNQAWRKYVGIAADGRPDLSSRKGYSRK
jgi:hypothetical protein